MKSNIKFKHACFYKLSLIVALLTVAFWNCFGSPSNSLSSAVKEGQHSPATPLGRLFIDAPTAQNLFPKISPAELWVRLLDEQKFSVEPQILEGNRLR